MTAFGIQTRKACKMRTKFVSLKQKSTCGLPRHCYSYIIHKSQVCWKPLLLQACFSWSVESCYRLMINIFHLATAYWYIGSPQKVYEWVEHPFLYTAIYSCLAIRVGKPRSARCSCHSSKILPPVSSCYLHGFDVASGCGNWIEDLLVMYEYDFLLLLS